MPVFIWCCLFLISQFYCCQPQRIVQQNYLPHRTTQTIFYMFSHAQYLLKLHKSSFFIIIILNFIKLKSTCWKCCSFYLMTVVIITIKKTQHLLNTISEEKQNYKLWVTHCLICYLVMLSLCSEISSFCCYKAVRSSCQMSVFLKNLMWKSWRIICYNIKSGVKIYCHQLLLPFLFCSLIINLTVSTF